MLKIAGALIVLLIVSKIYEFTSGKVNFPLGGGSKKIFADKSVIKAIDSLKDKDDVMECKIIDKMIVTHDSLLFKFALPIEESILGCDAG